MPAPRKPVAVPTADPSNPLIVQSDRTILVEVDNPKYAAARDALAPFAELEKSPEHIHTYRITPLSLWNAAAAGMTADAMVEVLARVQQVSTAGQPRHRSSPNWSAAMAGSAYVERGRAAQTRSCTDPPLARRIGSPAEDPCVSRRTARRGQLAVEPGFRGVLKQALIAVGYPAEDLAGYTEGAAAADQAADDHARAVCRSSSAIISAMPPTSTSPAATCAAAAA